MSVLSLAPHVVSLSLVCVVLYYCLQSVSFTAFHWHPVLMITAFAVLPRYGVSLVMRRSPAIKSHIRTQYLANVLAVCGFVAMYVNKERFNQPHISGGTWHALLGTIAVAWMLWHTMAAYFVFGTPNWNKDFRTGHAGSGKALMVFGLVVLVLGLYSTWWTNKASPAVWWYSIAAVVIIFVSIALPRSGADRAQHTQ